MIIEKAEDQASREASRRAAGPWSRGEAQVVIVRALPMMLTSDIYCRRLSCDRHELIS